MTPFIQELPRHYQRSPQDTELQRVLERMFARAEADKDFTLEQLFPSTASGWGLALWEAAYGLQRESGQTEEQRRARVLAKIKGTGTSTAARLLAIAQCFSDFPAELEEFPAEYLFYIWFIGTIGEVERPDMLREIINELKPAHLGWSVRYHIDFPAQVSTGGTMWYTSPVIIPDVWGIPAYPAGVITGGTVRQVDTVLIPDVWGTPTCYLAETGAGGTTRTTETILLEAESWASQA